ncbi:MAG TPA: hypothetical protein VMB19_06905 [Silvibacterium sp.]|nr:hypothetical protein [Silvibacterium sp.]
MNELLTKLSSYNLFNYLLPGVLFAILASETTSYHLIQKDIFTGVFLYYFLGMAVSRFGSLAIGPLLKRASFIKFADYKAFVVASKKDPQIEILSEVNNTYRTLSSLFGLLLVLRLYAKIEARFPFLAEWDATLLIVSLLVMFLFAYRKQTSFVVKRIKANE